jgi:hypothetical protein
MSLDEWYDCLARCGSLIEVDWGFPLSSIPRGKEISFVRYPDRSVRQLYYGSALIDPLLRDLCFNLNKHGYWTMGCCQGRTQLNQFDFDFLDERRHSPLAYVAFYDSIPETIQTRLKELGLGIYGENKAVKSGEYTGYHPSKEKPNYYIEKPALEDKEMALAANHRFVKCVRDAFGI